MRSMRVSKSYWILLLLIGLFSASSVFATTLTLKDVGLNFISQFTSFGKLLVAMAYLSGIGFSVAATFKFKQHKDNPSQVPIGMPLSMFFFSVFLIFLPSLYVPAGDTMFGNDAHAGEFDGSGINYLPGAIG